MPERLDVKRALRVFSKVVEHGQRVNGEHRLGDLFASSHPDGYTVTLHDHAVSLHIFFHNTHRFDYRRGIELDQFLGKIDEVDRRYHGSRPSG